MNHTQKLKSKILSKSICLATLLISIGYSREGHTALTDILQKYCVPKNGSDCSADARGTYKESGNFCECSTVSKHYNSTTRVCENCVTGSFASSNYKTCEPVNCPEGYHFKIPSTPVAISSESLCSAFW